MAYVSENPDYSHVKDLLSKSLAVDGIVKHWKKDQVDAYLEGVSRNLLLVPSSKASQKKSQREDQTFHDGVPATVVATGAESLILKRDMCDEMERYVSFLHKNWPNDAPVSSSKLAKAGFYYIGVNDTVQCFSCSGRINSWDHGDTAIGEHKRLYPKCKFVRGTDQRNVPYSGLVDEYQKGTEGKSRPNSASSSSKNEASGCEDDIVRILTPLTLQESKPTTETLDCFKREINRLLSFRNWPITSPVDRYDLAAAGFYCVNDTTVQCFSCVGRISEWRLGDTPRDEHRRLFPACPFISGHGTENVPLSASEKDQAIKHFAQTTAQESQPHQISSFVSEFQRIGGGSSVHGLSTHLLQLVTNQEPTDLTVRYAKYPDKAYEQARLETFYQWPITHNQIPANLARAGFFATGNDDEVKCFYCGGGLKDWDEGDDPWEEHARWFTRCEWLLQQRGPGFVDIVRKFNQSDQSYFEPNVGIPANQSTTWQSSPPTEDTPSSKGIAQSASSAVEKKTKKTKSLEERTFLKINFSHFLVRLAELLTLAVCEQLAVLFDFRPASFDSIRNSPTPALDLLRLMENRDIISPNEVSRLEEALTNVAANQAVQVVREYRHQVNKLNNSRKHGCVELSSVDMQSEKLEKLQDKNLCKICLDSDVEILFLPCKHLVTCSDCAERIDNCPICCELIDDRLYVYMP